MRIRRHRALPVAAGATNSTIHAPRSGLRWKKATNYIRMSNVTLEHLKLLKDVIVRGSPSILEKDAGPRKSKQTHLYKSFTQNVLCRLIRLG